MPDFTLLPPPAGGHADAYARGRRRRGLRAVTAGGAALSLVVVAAVLLPLGRPSSLHRLIPQPASSSTAQATTQPDTGESKSPSATPYPTAAGSPTPTMQVPASRPSPTGQVGPEMPAPAEPDRVVRAYSPPGDSFTLCGLDASVGGGPSETSVGWCNSADVTGKPGGYTFRAVVCRSSDQQAAQLHPESVPLRMRVTRGDTDVWHLTIGSEPRDALATEPGGCWIWSTDWDGLGDDGRPVRSGSYELSAAVLAEELPDTGDRTAAFEVGQS